MKTDLIIIGAGPGGYETALEAAKKGKSVILFNGGNLGGTCLNEGCIPTKCLCNDSEMIAKFKEGEKYGIEDFTFSIDYHKILERKNNVITSLKSGIETMLQQSKVELVNAVASFKDEKTVVANGIEYEADNIIIATGSVSKSLPIPGHDLECVMDSTRLLNLEYIPESLTIIGGGVIGMEFASIFNNLGSKVTVIEYMKQILPPFDSDISKRLKQSMSKRGISIITSAQAKEIKQNEFYEIEVTYEQKGKEGKVVSSDILMAVGRKAMTTGLNLEATGVNYSEKGIPVDDNMRTNVDGIYAIGDVNSRMMLAHVATFQGMRAINTIDNETDNIRFDIIPSAVFTMPECGMAGMTEEQCKINNIDILIGQSFYRANGKALAMGEPEGICKLIFNKADNRLIGAHIMGIEAADLAQQCADLMCRNVTQRDMTEIIFGHPTVSEIILNAARAVK
ncbi:MAG: dihydrolipoyl dehydrogenase [Muribaculaceae bacterium]|nr:dihydrolipoyl dehydrogenase [Muribaculaceae bacterium]